MKRGECVSRPGSTLSQQSEFIEELQKEVVKVFVCLFVCLFVLSPWELVCWCGVVSELQKSCGYAGTTREEGLITGFEEGWKVKYKIRRCKAW